MYYRSPICIDAKIGNNVFAYEKRMQSLGEAKIFVPALVDGTLDDVLLGESIVFAEMDDNDIKLCYGLRDIVRLSDRHCPIYIMDNHNHALYCRYKEYIAGYLGKGLTCIHIDQHSDMNNPAGWLDMEKEDDLNYIARYVNEVCTIADFIQPALHSGLLGECIQVRTENGLIDGSWIVSSSLYSSSQGGDKSYMLDIDIDFWAPGMSIGEFGRTIEKTRQLIAGASMVTIATSPYFIDQKRAVEIVRLLLM